MKQQLPPFGALTEEGRDRLERFVALLRAWNRRIALVARGDEESLWHRHVEDSLQIAPLLPAEGSIADLGSGGGFPGLVLAIALNRRVELIESDTRKASFLREAIRVTDAPARVHAVRAEALPLAPAAAVTARAFAPLPRLIPVAVRLMASSGICVLLKGTSIAWELTMARAQWQMHVECFESRTQSGSVILRLSEIRHASSVA